MAETVINAERGEHELTLGPKTYRLRPSYEAIVAIEEKTGKSLVELVQMTSRSAVPVATAGVIAAELIRAGADPDNPADKMTRAVSAEKIGSLIYEAGVPRAVARLNLCLIDAATGGRDAAGEAQAVAEDPTEEAATAD